MSTMTEVAGSQSVSNYFDPSQEKSRSKLARGVYPAHIIKCDKPKTVEFKGYKALIYNYVIKVDNAVTRHNFQVEDIDGVLKDVNSADYIGREIKSKGVFFFLNPEVGDSFKANPGGNRGFMEAVEAIGVDCPEMEIEVDGEKRMVKTLPNLSPSDFVGAPVLATVDLGKPWKGTDGVERQSFEVKKINKWEEGTKIDVELEDLPF